MCHVIAIWAYWQIPKSLMVRCVLEVTACLTQESELPTWHFSTRYSRARPPLFLEAAQVNLQLLAVTPDTSRRSWTQRKIFQNPSQKYFTLQQTFPHLAQLWRLALLLFHSCLNLQFKKFSLEMYIKTCRFLINVKFYQRIFLVWSSFKRIFCWILSIN